MNLPCAICTAELDPACPLCDGTGYYTKPARDLVPHFEQVGADAPTYADHRTVDRQLQRGRVALTIPQIEEAARLLGLAPDGNTRLQQKLNDGIERWRINSHHSVMVLPEGAVRFDGRKMILVDAPSTLLRQEDICRKNMSREEAAMHGII